MAADEKLVERIRQLLALEPAITEQAMFGGLAFLLGGNLAVSASREGGILVRVGPEAATELLATTVAEPAIMGSRRMRGWLRVRPGALRTEKDLAQWVERGVAQARAIPMKDSRH